MRRTRTAQPLAGEIRTDAELASLAAAGDHGAFEELYRRHAQAAWRVAQAVTNNPDDAADAVAEAFTKLLQALPAGKLAAGAPFRPYLLAATRNAAIDGLRKGGRARPSSSAGEVIDLRESSSPGPSERLLEDLDASLVAAAFRGLPERWRSVLWLTEVEGMPPREAAPLLGVSPNNAAQLAVRARAGLRERYLQAHINLNVLEACRYTVEHLGAYVGGGLAARDIAKVDQHVAECEDCRERLAELEDVGTSLRRIALPIPLVLGTIAASKWKVLTATAASVTRVPRPAGGSLLKAQRPLQIASTALFALGIIGAAVVSPPAGPQAAERRPRVPTQLVNVPTPAATSADPQAAGESPSSFAFDESAIPPITSGHEDVDGGLLDEGDDTVTVTDPIDPTPPGATPIAQVGSRLSAGPLSLTATAGYGDGSCTGGSLNGNGTGCQSGAPAGSGSVVQIVTGGSALGDHSLTAP